MYGKIVLILLIYGLRPMRPYTRTLKGRPGRGCSLAVDSGRRAKTAVRWKKWLGVEDNSSVGLVSCKRRPMTWGTQERGPPMTRSNAEDAHRWSVAGGGNICRRGQRRRARALKPAAKAPEHLGAAWGGQNRKMAGQSDGESAVSSDGSFSGWR